MGVTWTLDLTVLTIRAVSNPFLILLIPRLQHLIAWSRTWHPSSSSNPLQSITSRACDYPRLCIISYILGDLWSPHLCDSDSSLNIGLTPEGIKLLQAD